MTQTRTPPIAGQRWRHCKGTLYEILLTAMHTETAQPMVIYRKAHDPVAAGWARPLSMFMDRHSSGAWRFVCEEGVFVPTSNIGDDLDIDEVLADIAPRRAGGA